MNPAATVATLHERSSGVLLHPTCLPGPHGSGDLGPAAHAFVEFLARTGQSFWQMLPVGPLGYGSSPYSAQSAFAGNPSLISLTQLTREGLLDESALVRTGFPERRVDFGASETFRDAALRIAHAEFLRKDDPGERERIDAFQRAARSWLDDYALFRALKRAHGEAAWPTWEPELRSRKKKAIDAAREELAEEMAFQIFAQERFARQWGELRDHARARGVGLIGDLPIFVAHDSADVWQNQELFKLNEDGSPKVVAGVPPDYFSKTGQLWGNPLYRWSLLRKRDYDWWLDRVGSMLERFDAIRLDHFIGFHRFWEIPGGAATAETGRYKEGPGAPLFQALQKRFGALPLIAEDLGVVTPEVKALRDRFDLPGMRVLQFAFGDDMSASDFTPHNYPRRTIVYTGTHDNDTTAGWFHEQAGDQSQRSAHQIARERENALRYLGSDGRAIHWDMIRMAWLSVADVAIVPLQDVLGLGSEARMNRPGVSVGNWAWRFAEGDISPEMEARLASLTQTYGRARETGR